MPLDGRERCRFLVASGEAMQHVYDAMGNGLAYDAAVAGAERRALGEERAAEWALCPLCA